MQGIRHPLLNKKDLNILLAEVALGNSVAFSQLVNAYWKNVYYHALTYTRSPELAEESTQDIFVKIWDNRQKLPELDNFENFLFIVARNFIISAIRKKSQLNIDEISNELIEKGLSPDKQLEYKEFYERLLNGINKMPPQRKLVFTLSRLEGLSHEEISRRLGISKNTIKEHIVKGINYLKLYMSGEIS